MNYSSKLWRVHMEGDSGGFEKFFVCIINRVDVRMIFITKGLEIWQARDLYNTLCQVADSAILVPITDDEFTALAEKEEARCRKNVSGI